jgi:predicted dehydrogenase
VFAATARAPTQSIRPHLLAQVSLEADDALAALVFYADTRFGSQDRTIITGSQATMVSVGPNEKQQQVTVHLPDGAIQPRLEGCWFPDGFAGTMGELLCAIEEGRSPTINARDNLKALELCFAAVASAATHKIVIPGRVRKL